MTTGSSGSSVLAGTIALKGYWQGERTKKLEFDTHENAELVDLNKEILRLSGFNRHDCNDIPPPSIKDICKLSETIDLSKYRSFIEKCDANNPWVWKDPRLSYTIYFWKKLLDINGINFVFIEREPKQSYTGLILKRKVPMSYKEHNIMNANYRETCLQFFNCNSVRYLYLSFENLIVCPEYYLQKLSLFLENDIKLKDLQKVYHGSLYKKRWRTVDFYLACIHYAGYKYIQRDNVRFPRRKGPA